MPLFEQENPLCTQKVLSVLDSGDEYTEEQIIKEVKKVARFSDTQISKSITALLDGKRVGYNRNAKIQRLV